MFTKKAQGMSVNVIIIAILALLVLVILGFVFAGKIGDFVKGTKDCESIGGRCDLGTQCTGDEGYSKTNIAMCLDQATGKPNGQACCLKLDPTKES